MKKITTLFFILISSSLLAQIKGNITSKKGDPLSFVSIYLDKTITGTTSNDNGDYELNITKTGNYTVVFQFLGYKTLKKNVSVTSFPFALNAVLEEEQVVLDEISISTQENPANAIIRNVIANKEKNTDKLAKFTAKFYSRGLYRIKNAPKKFLGQTLGDLGGGLDSTRSGIIYLSETISEIHQQKRPKQFKEKIIASKVSGRDNGISFNRAEDVNLNFYDNNIEFGNDLVSPISNAAFGYYRFKLEGTFYDKNGKLINKINIIPKRKNDRVFGGSIYIVEDDWALYGADVTVTGAQINIPAVDVLRLKQNFNYSEGNDAWVLISQTIDFKIGFLGFNIDGRFSAAYSEYDFVQNFEESTFSNEVLTFAKEATKKDTTYWNKLRPVPLTSEEIKDYVIKDSIKVVRKSKKYLDSIDGVRNKFNWLNPITGYRYRNSYEKWSLTFDSPIDKISFNTVQGWNSTVGLNYFKRENDKGKWWNAGLNVNYGLSDDRVRPVFYFTKKWDNISRPIFNFSAGVETSQFNYRQPISSFYNMIYSLTRERNYMKIYEKTFARIGYRQEVSNGVRLNTSLEYADRKPLFNTTNYTIFGKDHSYTSNNPLDPTATTAPFSQHKIWTFNAGASIVFGQKYLSYPDSKINIGNPKYPRLYVGYRKMFGADNSNLNSDLFIARLRQNVNTGNVGLFRYNIRSGIFLKQKNLAFMDYLHPNGNQISVSDGQYMNRFNLLEYYKLSTNDKYAEFHAEHNFRGYLLGKVPLLNKLNFHLVAGAKALFTGDQKPYTEYSVGLDNIGFGKWRFLRVDYVRSNFNGIQNDGFMFGISLFN
ncbi:DUF5686 and carboxypeptidase regulatory-like domain-containing protein [Flavobacteriaceae bacterium S356]|uniref:DUF5686 and carboxypeptidase regulatory-like domain-containing protein n=1 Tax=Asprobacillus argus TaxID=3076534 RepID=A0ABU3LHB0_9FLAO|nr:DUF5686 and carboxypeptidase regulatory-like domain-containing protein [Flavobacteriaceae bacterium S356]